MPGYPRLITAANETEIISTTQVTPIKNGLGMHSYTQVVFDAFSDDVTPTEILIYPHEYDSIDEYNELYRQRRKAVEGMMDTTIKHAELMRKQCNLFHE